MANDDAPPQTPKPAGNAQRRGRPPKSRGDQDSSPGAPSEDAPPETAVATAELEGAEVVAEGRPEGVGPTAPGGSGGPMPPPVAAADRNRLDLAPPPPPPPPPP